MLGWVGGAICQFFALMLLALVAEAFARGTSCCDPPAVAAIGCAAFGQIAEILAPKFNRKVQLPSRYSPPRICGTDRGRAL